MEIFKLLLINIETISQLSAKFFDKLIMGDQLIIDFINNLTHLLTSF